MVSYRIVVLLLCASSLLTGVLGQCPCKFQGLLLPATIYDNYPENKPAGCTGTSCTDYPGKYKDLDGVKLYGTNCGVWDAMPGTPWSSYCPTDGNWSHPDYNWCQQAWCYVDAGCADGVQSSVFNGSDVAFYSYKSCGAVSDCYTNIAWNASYVWPTACPYDPTGGQTYKIHKSGDCTCKFQGQQLPTAIIDDYPEKMPAECTGTNCTDFPGKYKDMDAIKYYGTVCLSWDQMPGSPWYSYCPPDSDWCHRDFNWCQQPWCYVESTCTTAVASSVFKGSDAAFYSYDTCLGTPDCFTNTAWVDAPTPPAACPFDTSDNNWHTAKQCPDGWTASANDDASGSASGSASADDASSANTVEVAAVTMAVVLAALMTQP